MKSNCNGQRYLETISSSPVESLSRIYPPVIASVNTRKWTVLLPDSCIYLPPKIATFFYFHPDIFDKLSRFHNLKYDPNQKSKNQNCTKLFEYVGNGEGE